MPTTSSLPPDIDFSKDRSASPDRMNRAMLWLYNQIVGLQASRRTVDDELATLQAVGLAKIQAALVPVYDRLSAIANLGVLFNVTSATPAAVADGAASLVVDAGLRDQFAHCGFMIAVSRSDSRNAIMGRVESYDRPTGTLRMEVFIASGTIGSIVDDWDVMPCVPPFLPATVIDPGSDVSAGNVAIPYVLSTEAGSGTDVTELDPGIDNGSGSTTTAPGYIPGVGIISEVDPGFI